MGRVSLAQRDPALAAQQQTSAPGMALAHHAAEAGARDARMAGRCMADTRPGIAGVPLARW